MEPIDGMLEAVPDGLSRERLAGGLAGICQACSARPVKREVTGDLTGPGRSVDWELAAANRGGTPPGGAA